MIKINYNKKTLLKRCNECKKYRKKECLICFKNNYKLNIGYNKKEEYMYIKFINIKKKYIIDKLNSDLLKKLFIIWIKKNYNLYKSFFDKYNYTINDKRYDIYNYEMKVINKNLLILIRGEYIPNISSFLLLNKLNESPIQKKIIPEIKKLINDGIIK